ncbi:hypothetical protein [Reinekea sp.]|jgi:hypothetical protein|uniref:hypothetical protein n=1 Tax=Reinekea sp. TaxID=1970455 RepID=UPI002A7FA3D6|nr:hypothetical protein [Reinekea sp.]
MKLVVFDLDTALCQTSAMDGLAMASAIKDVAKCRIEPETVRELHDFASIWYRATQRFPSARDLVDLQERFGFHLRRQFLIRPSVIPANYGLIEQINLLQHQKNTIVGLVSATSAAVMLLKAHAIGLVCQTLPLATGEDADSLPGILLTMQARVRRSFGFNFESCDLIAGLAWRGAATAAQMNHYLPVDYLASGSVQIRDGQFTRSSKLFSFADY